MAQTCPSCGSETPDGASYCPSCGASLTATPAAAGRKERKYATALFADLVGSTAMAEAEDPEVVEQLIGSAFERLAGEIERYGGLLEKFIGDALLAVFGVPNAHEDDPERGVRAALEMHAILSELNRGFAAAGRPQLAMRIGIEAGEVLVDLERVAGTRERMLTGDAVNVAARLQGAADPGSAIVGPAAYAATKAVIDYRELPPLSLKGKAVQVQAWQALRVKARRRGERVPLGLEARLVGRDEELAVLKQTLQRVESEGRAALVTVFGAAGVGKSRLTWELLKYVEGLPGNYYWRKGRCLAYGGISYSALADAIKAQCEVLEDDPPEAVVQKVERAVEELFGDRAVAPQLLALVGAGEERTFPREDLFDAWRRFFERMAARYPLVLVLEDIHWADAGLLDFVEHLVDWAVGPILVLTLARPELLEIRPTWGGGKRNYVSIFLDPLTPSENEAMLEDLLPAALPADLKRHIVERSEGNPLFTEEIVRMLIDRGVLRATDAARWEIAAPVEELDLPRSIQGLIAARLDTLPPEEKAVLQDASVVGRIFWLGAVDRLGVSGRTKIREALGRLRVKELLVPREPPAFSDEIEFAFRHVLIRDVAYDSLPKTARAGKHAEVARWAEERAGERRDEIAELIASHYAEALRYEREVGARAVAADLERKAFEWARAAGDRSFRLWQRLEAARWYRYAIELAGSLGITDEASAALWEAYGQSLIETSPWTEASAALLEARQRYERVGRQRDVGRVEAFLARVAFQSGLDDEVLPWVERALEHLEPFGDSIDLALALHHLGWYHWRRGNVALVEEPVRRAIEMARRLGARALEADALVTLGSHFGQSGGWHEEARALVEEGLETARQAGAVNVILRASNNLAAGWLETEPDPSRPEAIVREALELARHTAARGFEGWLLGTLAYLLSIQGRLDEADVVIRQGLEAAEQVGERPRITQALRQIASLHAEQGRLDEAQRTNEDADRLARENPEPQDLVWGPIIDGRIALGRAGSGAAAVVFLGGARRFEEHLQQSGGETLLFETVRALVRTGRPAEALPWRDRLREVAPGRPYAEAYLAWTEALLEPDGAVSEAALGRVAERLAALRRPIDRARALVDLAIVQARNGRPAASTLAAAERVFEETGARLYLNEVEAAAQSIAQPAGA